MTLRMHAMLKLFCLALLGAVCADASAGAETFLAPELAFAFSVTPVDAHTVHLHWNIAPGYHLYRERITVAGEAGGAAPPAPALPPGSAQYDPTFNKTMTIYQHALDLDLDLGKAATVTVGWQGCADAGLCYAPASIDVHRPAPLESSAGSTPSAGAIAAGGAVTRMPEARSAAPSASAASTPPASAPGADSIAQALASGSLLRTIGMFWLAGLLLSLTPCVLPMVPILSSLIAGQSGPVSRAKGFQLALAYAFGMALVYAGFGVAAGLAGEGLAAALQNPWVLGAFALLLSTLAMSMFGFYELQMPSAIQSRATDWANRFRGGNLIGVFVMGGVSALVVGPCVAAPLAGALVYISQTGDVMLGGLALFTMALGMSVPLLLVGLSAGSLLPRAGAWMEEVKKMFGMMLLGVAIWMLAPVLPASAHMLLWACWLLTGAALLGLFGGAGAQHAPPAVAARAAGFGLATLSLLLIVGAASGGQSVLQPLAHLRGAQAGGTPATSPGLQFERVASVQALDAALAQAQQQGQPVMLDFYADWCVACKEFESLTFTDPQVRQRLGKVRLLQVDVTANNANDKALLKRFSLFGPPGIVFFDRLATAHVTHKVIGYQGAVDFLASLQRAAI